MISSLDKVMPTSDYEFPKRVYLADIWMQILVFFFLIAEGERTLLAELDAITPEGSVTRWGVGPARDKSDNDGVCFHLSIISNSLLNGTYIWSKLQLWETNPNKLSPRYM